PADPGRPRRGRPGARRGRPHRLAARGPGAHRAGAGRLRDHRAGAAARPRRPAAPGARVTADRVVLVEGESDRAALLALAARQGWDPAAEGVAVLAMGGVTNVGHFLADVDPGA